MKKWISITLNLHPNDCQLFEDWTLLILHWLETPDVYKYSYAIEKDGTVDRHLHCIVEVDMRDAEKVFSRLSTQEFTCIKKNLKKSKSILAVALHCANVNKEKQKILGYVNKWHTPRRGHKGFTDDEIISAVEYYYTVERLKKAQDVSDDWIHVTTKNFHAIVEDYVKKNQPLDIKESGLVKLNMVKNRHSFMSINLNQLEIGFKELRIAATASTPDDEHTCANEAFGMKKDYDTYMEDDIKDLIKYIQANSPTGCTPDSLNPIYHKYQHLF
jgi:hypothetical protein